MTRHYLISVAVLAAVCCIPVWAQSPAAKSNTDYVDTRIGTDKWQKESTLSTAERPSGYVYPGVGTLYPMTQWTPQTVEWDRPYFWNQPTIRGFRCSHYPNGASMSEYGAFTIMPSVGTFKLTPNERGSAYSHETEVARPYYYSVRLDAYDIKAELTAVSKSGYMRFTYPKSEEAHILIDNPRSLKGSYFHVIPERNEVEGYTDNDGRRGNRGYVGREFACYFVARFSKPLTSYAIVPCPVEEVAEGDDATLVRQYVSPLEYTAEQLARMAENGSMASALRIDFATAEGEQVEVRIGTSFINMEQARRNLQEEIGDKSFETVMKETAADWDEGMSKITIEASEDTKAIFYTSLYNCMQTPRNLTEDGYHYSAFNGKTMPGLMYTDFSIWDTFRSLHPLLILIQPERDQLMIQALLNSYDEGGWMPKWPSPGYSNIMHGTHADAVIADAYVKGLRDFDAEKALSAMVKDAAVTATGVYKGRVGISDYMKLGYVPTDKYKESAIRTMEFAYDDFCIAQMAKLMGRDSLYEVLMARSKNYINVLDPETGMVRGRNSDGQWRAADDASISIWARGTDLDRETYFRNITLFVPHDVDGLVEFMGGRKDLEAYLDHFFSNNFYYVGDEFSMHSPYLYNFLGCPWKTQKLMRELLENNFANAYWGLPGNEDCGQLSSWYLMGAMGFYPFCPGKPVYQIGSPAVDKAQIRLANGKVFTIIAQNNSKDNVYIQSATLDGKPYDKCWIHHDDIMKGSTLVLKMGSKPNRRWGKQ